MPRDISIYLDDISEAVSRIRSYTEGLGLEQFRADAKTVDAVIRNLEVIGDAAKKLPEEIKQKDSPAEWRKIAGLRDILSHEYFGIDSDMIWDIVSQKIPSLASAVSRLQHYKANSWT